MKTKVKTIKPNDKKYGNIKKLITEFLENKGSNESIDFALIEELIYNYYIADSAKLNIETFGIMVNVVRDPDKEPLYQSNQALAVYNNAVKNITLILTKLALTPQERKKIETQIVQESINQLDKDMQGYD